LSEQLSRYQLSIYINTVDNYIRRRGNKRARIEEKFPLLIAVAKVLVGDIIDAIDKHVCPFCGATMKSRVATIGHVLRYHSDMYYSNIKYVVSVYVRLRSMMKKTTILYDGRHRTEFKLFVGGRIIRGRHNDIAKAIERDPSILQKLGLT
jgi:hypothetical protein